MPRSVVVKVTPPYEIEVKYGITSLLSHSSKYNFLVWHISRRNFDHIPEISRLFCEIRECSVRFYKVLNHSRSFYELLCKKFENIPQNSSKFWRFLECSTKFENVLKDSTMFWIILEVSTSFHSRIFHKIRANSRDF